jgi:hypothetical protein
MGDRNNLEVSFRTNIETECIMARPSKLSSMSVKTLFKGTKLTKESFRIK